MEINERIFYLLDKQGKTAKELGLHIGVNPSSISAWKNEGSYPSSKYIIGISEFFNVSIEFLFTGTESTTDLVIYEELDRMEQPNKKGKNAM